MRRCGSLPGRVATQTAAFIAGGRADHLRIGDRNRRFFPWTGRNFNSLPDSQLAGNRRGAAEFFEAEANDGDAQSAESEAEKSDREAHGQRCEKTPLSVCEGQEEEIPGGIRPI